MASRCSRASAASSRRAHPGMPVQCMLPHAQVCHSLPSVSRMMTGQGSRHRWHTRPHGGCPAPRSSPCGGRLSRAWVRACVSSTAAELHRRPSSGTLTRGPGFSSTPPAQRLNQPVAVLGDPWELPAPRFGSRGRVSRCGRQRAGTHPWHSRRGLTKEGQRTRHSSWQGAWQSPHTSRSLPQFQQVAQRPTRVRTSEVLGASSIAGAGGGTGPIGSGGSPWSPGPPRRTS